MEDTEQVLRFIQDYQSYECLWNQKIKDYTNRNIRMHAFNALCAKYHMDVKSIKNKIKSLRSYFSKEHKKVKKKRSASEDPYISPWFAYRSLLFIVDANTSRQYKTLKGLKSHGNPENFPVGSPEHSEEDSTQHCQYRSSEQSQVDSPEYFRTESSNSEIIQQIQVEPLQVSDQTYENFNTNKHINKKRNLVQDPLETEELTFMRKTGEPSDEHYIFGQLIAEKIRKLSKMNQAVAQYRINSVLFELEMEELNTATAT